MLGIFKHKFLTETFKFCYINRWFTLDWSVYFNWYAFYYNFCWFNYIIWLVQKHYKQPLYMCFKTWFLWYFYYTLCDISMQNSMTLWRSSYFSCHYVVWTHTCIYCYHPQMHSIGQHLLYMINDDGIFINATMLKCNLIHLKTKFTLPTIYLYYDSQISYKWHASDNDIVKCKHAYCLYS